MDSYEYQKLQKQLDQANQKINDLHRMMGILLSDVGANQGFNLAKEVEILQSQMRQISSDLNSGDVRNITYNINDIKRSIANMTRRIGEA